MSSSLCFISGICMWCVAITSVVQAQVTSDQTLSTKVNTSNNLDFIITNGNQLGENLFHSFQHFSVPEGGSASFANGLDIQNIFSRVTGNSLSEINGLIQTNGSANLFLFNPNGIIFGRNAQLNIGGSFITSTASQINFADGSIFRASDSQTKPLLTVSIPIGLQFGENPGNIINRSVANDGFGLTVLADRTLAFIGGNLFLEGGVLTTIGGRIELGSVASNASVSLTPIDAGWELDYDTLQEFQDIQLSEGAIVQTALFTQGSGEIFLQGRQILFSGNSEILSLNRSKTEGGRIKVTASELVKITEDSNLSASSSTETSADINIETKRLVVRDDNSFIQTEATINGRGGNLTIDATESVEVDGGGGFNGLTTQTFGNGDAGTLKITTGRLTLRNGGQLSSSTSSVGNGGQVIIEASESIEIIGKGILGDEIAKSGMFAQTRGNVASGNSGNISINTNHLSVQDGGTISVAAVEGSTGRAGNLEIDANSLSLNQGSINAETAQSGGEEGANITLNLSDLLTLDNESTISATANDLANGGNIEINSDLIVAFPNQNNDITASASQGNGGEINITTRGIFGIEERSSNPDNETNDIDASSEFGLDGTITINELDANPAEGLEELSTAVIDPNKLVPLNLCSFARDSEFYLTGQGGIAPNLAEIRDEAVIAVDLVEPVPFGKEVLTLKGTPSDKDTASHKERRSRGAEGAKENRREIVEAQGWIIDEEGIVELVAYKTDVNGSPIQPKDPRVCPK